MPEDVVSLFWYWIKERYKIYQLKEGGASPPWTSDPILQKYKFTNVFRELDRTSKWVANNWREPNKDDRHCWFAILVSVLVNLEETMAELGYPVPYDEQRCTDICESRKRKGLKTYSSAYIINSPQGVNRSVRIFTHTLAPIWERREHLHWENYPTLEDWHRELTRCYGLGSFLAAQVIAGAKYLPGLLEYPDWWTFAQPGPGSLRGLNVLLECPVNRYWKEDDWYHCLYHLRDTAREELPLEIESKMHMQDLQNCLCEFDKYYRVVSGNGKPKQLYTRSN